MPVASAVWPGPSGPLAGEIVSCWLLPGVPTTLMRFVLVTVAAPQLAPLTWMLPATVRPTMAASVLSVTVTVDGAAAEWTHVAALAAAGSAKAAAPAATAGTRSLRHLVERLGSKGSSMCEWDPGG